VYATLTAFAATVKDAKIERFDAKDVQAAVDSYLGECKDKHAAAGSAEKFKPKAGKPTYYYFPGSPPARGILHWLNETGHDKSVDLVVVDVKNGEHKTSDYRKIHPRGLVPALVDGEFTLTESAAIFRYLAIKFKDSVYPTDAAGIQARAKVNETMAWFNTGLYGLLAYHCAFPQTVAAGLWSGQGRREAEWAVPHVRTELNQLENALLVDAKTHKPKTFLLGGEKPTIVDFFAWSLMGVGLLVNQDLSDYLHITRWDRAMKALKSTAATMAPVYGFLDLEVWGPRKDKVAVRPLPDKYVRIWTVTVHKADIDAKLALTPDLVQHMRGQKGVRSVEAAICRESGRFTSIVTFSNKAAWVAYTLSDKTEEHDRATKEKTARMMDPATSVVTDGLLLDI